MKSKNKAAMTAKERAHVDKIAQQSCVVCDDSGVEIHEFEQGQWFTAVPVCPACHRGPQGWHGTRQRWTMRKMDMLKAINETLRRAAA